MYWATPDLELTERGNAVIVLSVLDPAAVAAGPRPGDHVVGIDGVPVTGIGYVRMRSIEERSPRDRDEVLASLALEHSLDGLILDLRDHGGGPSTATLEVVKAARFAERASCPTSP